MGTEREREREEKKRENDTEKKKRERSGASFQRWSQPSASGSQSGVSWQTSQTSPRTLQDGGEVEWGGTGGGAGQAACTQASGAQQRGWQAWMEATGSGNNARHVPHTATHVFVMLPGFHAAKHT